MHSDDWAKEGRRVISLMPRSAAQTVYSVIANDTVDSVTLNNKELPPPACIERKRSHGQQQQVSTSDDNNSSLFNVPESPKVDESKKRKLSFSSENFSVIHHLTGPQKISKIQQIYR